jgi:hypothetical protein
VNCRNCSGPISRGVYCSNSCQIEFQLNEKEAAWLRGEITGNCSAGETYVSRIVKRWLIKTKGEKCEKCGWAERNQFTGKIPLQINHKDGDWSRTVPENLELVCPNCHSLTPHHGNLNKGRGRPRRCLKVVETEGLAPSTSCVPRKCSAN